MVNKFYNDLRDIFEQQKQYKLYELFLNIKVKKVQNRNKNSTNSNKTELKIFFSTKMQYCVSEHILEALP